MKIVVLGGGDSPEREVSLRSSEAVHTALLDAGYKAERLDPHDETIMDGLEPGTIIFPILHGKNGEDGVLQEKLERLGFPYLGSKADASRRCFDKDLTRQTFAAAGLPVAAGSSVTRRQYESHTLTAKPHVLKVCHGGSSIGTYIVRNPELPDMQMIDEVFRLDEHAIIEELVEGIEMTVPVLDQAALPVIEIIPPDSAEFDYENKYNGRTAELCPPRNVSPEQQKQAKTLAMQAHTAMGCRHLSRTDMIMREDGSFVLLEINTIPGMTNQSLFPKSAAVAGLSFPQLADRFVGLVARDYGINNIAKNR